jgi:SAM-dependent methyltransferase
MIFVARAVACSVCEGGQVDVQYASVSDYFTGDEFAVLDCARCGVKFTYPPPSTLHRYYPATYRAYRQPVLYLLGALYRMRARGWARAFDEPGDLLEIGCGPGLTSSILARAWLSATGLERSENAGAYGRREFGLDIAAGKICRPSVGTI